MSRMNRPLVVRTITANNSVPIAIWLVVCLLAIEGVGNLLSIPRNPYAAWWLAAKVLFITGLLRRWRWVFVLFLFVATNHVVGFFQVMPIIALMNLALVVAAASAWRYYFPSQQARDLIAKPYVRISELDDGQF